MEGSQMSGYDPFKDPNIEYMIKLQQLNMIAASLQSLYPHDQTIATYIKQATQMLQSGNINSGAETLQVTLLILVRAGLGADWAIFFREGHLFRFRVNGYIRKSYIIAIATTI
jgi:hypothetical protein